MRRKLIRQGHSTLTLSLPKEWAESNKLKPGDELEVITSGREVRLQLPREKSPKAVKLDVSKLSTALVRSTLNTYYVQGMEELRITCLKSQHRTIQETVDNLIGMAIVEQQPSKCVVKDMTAPGEVEFPTLIRRIYRMVIDLAQECKEDFLRISEKESPLTTPEQAAERDLGINRFANFTLRQLSRMGHLDTKKTAAYFHLVLLLELVADEYTNLWKALVIPNTVAGRHGLTLYSQALSMTQTCYDLLYKYDAQEASSVSRTRNIIRTQLDDTLDVPLPIAFHIRKIAEFSVNLLQAQLLLIL